MTEGRRQFSTRFGEAFIKNIKWTHVLAGILIGVILVGLFQLIKLPQKGTSLTLVTVTPNLTPEPTATLHLIQVHVAGEVQQPGLYHLPEGSNVQDAIEAALGASENAGLDLINLATILNDGQRITIPPKTDHTDSLEIPQRSSGLQVNSLVNINTASQAELESLPGIGQVKARAIIDYRTQNGYFLNLEELMNVEGIGQKTFEQLKELITIDP